MSYTIFLSMQVELSDECPEAVLAYFRYLAPGSDMANPPPGVVDLIDQETEMGSLPTPGWFAAPWGHIALTANDQPGQSKRINLYGSFHDEFVQHQYALLNLVARHAKDGPFAMEWNSLSATEATTFMAHDGVLFGAKTGQGFTAISVNDPDRRPPIDPALQTDANFSRLHGLSEDAGAKLVQAEPNDPFAARYLLTRTVARAVTAATQQGRVDVDPTVEAIVADVLALLDGGSDPLAAPDAPGWKVVETRLVSGSRRETTGRAANDLVAMLPLVDTATINLGPTRLVPGMTLVALTEFELTARSDHRISRGNGAYSNHQLRVQVPAGARLTITKAYERGHALCFNDEWSTWPLRVPPGVAGDEAYSDHPIGLPSDYNLGAIQVKDEHVLWRTDTPGT